MKLNNKANLFKIKNNYILKSLFTYLHSQNILNLVQNDKILRSKLDITSEHYKIKTNLPKYEYIKETKIHKSIKKKHPMNEDIALIVFGQIFTGCIACIFLTYHIIYSILLIALDTFDDSNTKENYNKSSEIIINKINVSLFILLAFIITSCLLLIFYIYVKCQFDYGFKKIIKSILIITINIIHYIFEGLVIWKLVLSYQIKRDGITWFMRMDYAFIILHFLYIVFIILCTIVFFATSGRKITKSSKCILKSFNNIRINDYILPDNFNNWEKNERKNFILNNYKFFQCSESQNLNYLKDSYINEYRKNNNILTLISNEDKTIPDFIINEPGEIMLFPEHNFFKLSNKEYLFKYNDELENKIKNKDKDIMEILLKENINSIKSIITKGNKEYILLFSSPKKYNVDLSNDKEEGYLYKEKPFVEINVITKYFYE